MPAILFFALLMAFGCAHDRITSVGKLHSVPVQDIFKQGDENRSLIGHFKLRATGLKRFLGTIELDVIAQEPHNLYLAIESFFRQPARVLRFNGTSLQGLSEKELERLLDLPIKPSDLVDIFLRRLSAPPFLPKKVRIEANQIYIPFPSQQTLLVELDPNGLVKKRTLLDRSGAFIYAVSYLNYPFEFELEVTHQNQTHKAILSSRDVKLNQGPIDEQLFHR